CLIASPFSRPGYVSSTVYDHTSILATIEHKWNLAPLTARDAAANPLFDFLELTSAPALLNPPALPHPVIWPLPAAGGAVSPSRVAPPRPAGESPGRSMT